MGAALAGVQPEFFWCDIDPTDLNIYPSYKYAFTFIGDRQNCLAAAFDFRGVNDLSKIQDIWLDFQPGLRSLSRRDQAE